jgi:hypothetical protein
MGPERYMCLFLLQSEDSRNEILTGNSMHLQDMPKPWQRQLEREIEILRDQVCFNIRMALIDQLQIETCVKILFLNNCDMQSNLSIKSPASYHSGLYSNLDQVIWDLWWIEVDKVHLVYILNRFRMFYLSVCCLNT